MFIKNNLTKYFGKAGEWVQYGIEKKKTKRRMNDGAIKLGMLIPDIFASVYTLSPYVLSLEKDYGLEGEAYKQA